MMLMNVSHKTETTINESMSQSMSQSNQTKSNQTKPNQIKPKKSNQKKIKPKKIKPKKSKKSNQTKSNQIKFILRHMLQMNQRRILSLAQLFPLQHLVLDSKSRWTQFVLLSVHALSNSAQHWLTWLTSSPLRENACKCKFWQVLGIIWSIFVQFSSKT